MKTAHRLQSIHDITHVLHSTYAIQRWLKHANYQAVEWSGFKMVFKSLSVWCTWWYISQPACQSSNWNQQHTWHFVANKGLFAQHHLTCTSHVPTT